MSKVGLIDVDGHGYPNLALMKLSTYHKELGDTVEFAKIGNYDIVYSSKVFTFTKDKQLGLISCDEHIKGGTGYQLFNKLPEKAEHLQYDYSLYPNNTEAYGFLTRGCPNHCSWCIVPKKEGNIEPYADIEEILQGRNKAIIMDNNIIAHEYGLDQIEKIIKLGIKVDFNQGLDVRLIAKDKSIAKLLSRVKYIDKIRMACDTQSQIPYIRKALEYFNEFGIKNYRTTFLVLVKDIPDALIRVNFLKEMGCTSYAQPYRNFVTNEEPAYELKRFARWNNRKEISTNISWEDYNPEKSIFKSYKK